MLITVHTAKYIPELRTNGPIFSPVEVTEDVYNSLVRHGFHVEIYKTPQEIKMEQKKEEKKMIASLIPKKLAAEVVEKKAEEIINEYINDEEKNNEPVTESVVEEQPVEEVTEEKTVLEDESVLEVKLKNKKNRR